MFPDLSPDYLALVLYKPNPKLYTVSEVEVIGMRKTNSEWQVLDELAARGLGKPLRIRVR